MKTITHIDKNKLAFELQQILLDMKKDGLEPSFPVERFEQLIMERHGVSKKEAEKVTEAVISTGVIRWEIFANNLVL